MSGIGARVTGLQRGARPPPAARTLAWSNWTAPGFAYGLSSSA